MPCNAPPWDEWLNKIETESPFQVKVRPEDLAHYITEGKRNLEGKKAYVCMPFRVYVKIKRDEVHYRDDWNPDQYLREAEEAPHSPPEKTKEVWGWKRDYLAYRKYQEEEMDLQYINVAH